jgi:hypothetical protein
MVEFGKFTTNEFIIAFQAFGHENEKLIRKTFELMNPKDGLIPLKDVVNAWIQFTTCDDPHKKDDRRPEML